MGLVFGGAKLDGDKVVLPDLDRKTSTSKKEAKAEPIKPEPKKESKKQ